MTLALSHALRRPLARVITAKILHSLMEGQGAKRLTLVFNSERSTTDQLTRLRCSSLVIIWSVGGYKSSIACMIQKSLVRRIRISLSMVNGHFPIGESI